MTTMEGHDNETANWNWIGSENDHHASSRNVAPLQDFFERERETKHLKSENENDNKNENEHEQL